MFYGIIQEDAEVLDEGLILKSPEYKEVKQKIKAACKATENKINYKLFSRPKHKEVSEKIGKEFSKIFDPCHYSITVVSGSQHKKGDERDYELHHIALNFIYKKKLFSVWLGAGMHGKVTFAALNEHNIKYPPELAELIIKETPTTYPVLTFKSDKVQIYNCDNYILRDIVDNINKKFEGKYEASLKGLKSNWIKITEIGDK